MTCSSYCSGFKKNEKVHFNVGCILFLDANKAYLFDNSVLGIVFFLNPASYKNLESAMICA